MPSALGRGKRQKTSATERNRSETVSDIDFLHDNGVQLPTSMQVKLTAMFYTPVAEIYRSAFLTIIAASGEDAEAGLAGLRPGTRSFQQREIVVISPDQDQPGLSLLSVCKRVPKEFGEFFDMLDEDADNSTWNTRGWTLQERALSRRNLIFTEEQVLWVCDGAYFCEETAFEHPIINETGHLPEEHTPIRFELLKAYRLNAANLRSLDGKVARIVSSSKSFWTKYRMLVQQFTIAQLGLSG